MTTPFPTHKQEDWRYADLDALRPVWDQFAEPVTVTVAPGESLEEVWLPTAADVQLRRVQIALERGASARIFVLNAAPVYGRIELEVIDRSLTTTERISAVQRIIEEYKSLAGTHES